jgi:transcriptional regulator with XRE-family HTH domain
VIQLNVADAVIGAAILTGSKPTKANLARVIGVHRSQVLRWERGETVPTDCHQIMMGRLIWLKNSRDATAVTIELLKEKDDE